MKGIKAEKVEKAEVAEEVKVEEATAEPKKIMVTGGEGFIGRKVVEKLRDMGHEVYPYDIVSGYNLMNLEQLEEAIQTVDIVFHIAAQADFTKMTETVEDGFMGVMLNVDATHNVAYMCAKYKKWMIHASTVCVYGNIDEHPEREDTTLPNPSEIYACSKYAAEWIIKGYGKTFGLDWTIQRYATIYGEGMRPALGMHIFFTQAMNGDPITVHGDGLQDRTLTFIDDLVEGIIAPLARPEQAKGQVFNLTAPTPVTAKKMAEDIKELTGSSSEIVFGEQRPNQTFHEDFDVSKAKELLGWEAKTKWGDGLKKTYEWMKGQTNRK